MALTEPTKPRSSEVALEVVVLLEPGADQPAVLPGEPHGGAAVTC